MNNNITVLIVDDHDLFRIGLKTALLPFEDIEIVGEAASGLEAVECCNNLLPDVILMDLNMPEMGGIEAISLIRRNHPPVQILVLTTFHDKPQIQAAIQAGAIGYLLKDVHVDMLAESIRDAHRGKATLSSDVAQALIETVRQPSPAYSLTAREKEVLGYLVKGLTNEKIAATMSVSSATAKKHVSNILTKLNARSRAEAVAIALRERLIDPE